MALLLTFLLNTLLLKRRFEPFERLRRDDGAGGPLAPRPAARARHSSCPEGSTDVQRLAAAFNRMLERLERERRRSGELVLLAQEEERKRIARDLHDEVNQSLDRPAAADRRRSPQDAPPSCASSSTRPSASPTRRWASCSTWRASCGPTALDDHGLVAALQTHVKEYDRRSDASAHFWADPAVDDLELGDDVQVVVYRVAQEALVNASRHSGASRIEVNLERQNGAVNLSVADNGSGFAFADEGKGLGLSGMRERALLVGGRLEIDSRPGTGTTVKLEVPAR